MGVLLYKWQNRCTYLNQIARRNKALVRLQSSMMVLKPPQPNKQSIDIKEQGRHLKITNIDSRSLPVLPDHLRTEVTRRREASPVVASIFVGWLAEMDRYTSLPIRGDAQSGNESPRPPGLCNPGSPSAMVVHMLLQSRSVPPLEWWVQACRNIRLNKARRPYSSHAQGQVAPRMLFTTVLASSVPMLASPRRARLTDCRMTSRLDCAGPPPEQHRHTGLQRAHPHTARLWSLSAPA